MSECSYVLTKGFTTPLTGFKVVVIGGHGDGTLSLTGLTLQHGNSPTTDGQGGGGAIWVAGHLDATSCLFNNNAAPGHDGYGGGAVYVAGGSATMTSCDFSQNTADGGSGGAVFASGPTALKDCTFAGGAGSNTDSVLNGAGNTTFACPKGATGTPVVFKDGEELKANQLPPAKE
jgi:predicted outer membrane repeat protein